MHLHNSEGIPVLHGGLHFTQHGLHGQYKWAVRSVARDRDLAGMMSRFGISGRSCFRQNYSAFPAWVSVFGFPVPIQSAIPYGRSRFWNQSCERNRACKYAFRLGVRSSRYALSNFLVTPLRPSPHTPFGLVWILLMMGS